MDGENKNRNLINDNRTDRQIKIAGLESEMESAKAFLKAAEGNHRYFIDRVNYIRDQIEEQKKHLNEETAPYLKKTDDKPPEKIGGVRI